MNKGGGKDHAWQFVNYARCSCGFHYACYTVNSYISNWENKENK